MIRFREARQAAGIKAEQAAAQLGVSVTTLFSWERADTSPSASSIIDMVSMYGVSADYLLGLMEPAPAK